MIVLGATRAQGLWQLWAKVRSYYWFIPTLIILGCIGLSYAMFGLDSALPPQHVLYIFKLYNRDPAGARALLSVISQSMITVAGVVFSVTVVALALATSQFGTRVLKSFARDTGNQIVLGTFLGTFLYGLLVMSRVESQPRQFVPSYSVAVAIVLAMASVVVLVYFLHHVIMIIQAENVVAAVTRDLYGTIDAVFPREQGHRGYRPQPSSNLPVTQPGTNEVRSEQEGFVRSIDTDRILRLAIRHEAVVKVELLPGAFVTPASVLACFSVFGDASVEMRRSLARCFDIGHHRTYDQDIGFAFDQLALIAVRSMSPAINALGTAQDAVDWLKSALIRLGQREIPSPYHYDSHNRLRVITATWNWSSLLDQVLDPIRQGSQMHPGFILHTIEALAEAASAVRNPALSAALQEHICKLGDTASEFPQEVDKRRVRLVVARFVPGRRSAS